MDISEKKIVVIGGGVIATRRVKTLLEFTENITIIAPEVTQELKQIVQEEKVVWIAEVYPHHDICDNRWCNKKQFFSENVKISEEGISTQMEQNEYFSDKLKGADIVIAATNSKTVNHQVREDCRLLEQSYGKSILVSVADDKNLCNFYFPSIVEKENIVVGINSGGQSPKQTKEIRKKIEDILEAESFYERK